MAEMKRGFSMWSQQGICATMVAMCGFYIHTMEKETQLKISDACKSTLYSAYIHLRKYFES